MPLSGKATAVAGGCEGSVQRVGVHGPDIQDLMARQAQPRGQTAGVGTRPGGKINLEAYEAYHNSRENALLLSHTQSEELALKDGAYKAEKSEPATGTD